MEQIKIDYQVVEMVNGDFYVQAKEVSSKGEVWVTCAHLLFATAAEAHTAMISQIETDQEVRDSCTIKRVVEFE